MPRYNRLRTSGEQEYTKRDSYLFQAEDHHPAPLVKLGPQAPAPVASSGSVSPGSGPPSSGSPDEGGSDAAEKEVSPKGKAADASPAGRKAGKEAPSLDESADGVREKTVQRRAAQNGSSEYGGGRFGATLHRVTSFRESSKQSRYSRLADGAGEWEKESGEGEKVDPWGERGNGHESDWLSTFSIQKAASTRDGGSWAAAVQRSASMRDAGGYAASLEPHFRGSTNPFERHLNHVPDSGLAPAPDSSRHVINGLGTGTGTNPFERSSTNMEWANGNGYSRGRGGGFGVEPISVPNMDRDRDEMPSSLGAAVQRALSLREGHLASASSRASYQSFHQAQGPDYSTPVFSNSSDRQGSWEQEPEHRYWGKPHSQSMRYDRVSLPVSDPDEDFGYRSSSVGERDRNAGMTAAAVLQRAASVREQAPSRAALTSSRVYSMREQSHVLQCSNCGRGLGVLIKGVPGPEDATVCQACSKPRVASHWTDPANGRYAVPAWAVPPKKKKGILHTCRRLLGLKTATTATAR